MQVFVLRKTRRTEHSPEHDARDKEFFDHFYSKQNVATSLRQSDNDYNPILHNRKIQRQNERREDVKELRTHDIVNLDHYSRKKM